MVDYTSAYEQFYGRKVNFKRHLRLGFGDYAEVHNNQPTTSNTLQPRALSCIALLPLMNRQGTYLFFSLKTRRLLKGDRWTPLPTPQWVADRMNALARSQKKQLPKDLVYTIGDAPEDQPHVDDEDIINLAEPDEDDPEVTNEGQEPPEDLEDWDNDMPERVESDVESEEADDDELGVARQGRDPTFDEAYEPQDETIPVIDHGHRTRSSTGTKPTLAPFHTAAEGYSALVTSVLKFGVPVGPSVQATALIPPSEEPVRRPAQLQRRTCRQYYVRVRHEHLQRQ